MPTLRSTFLLPLFCAAFHTASADTSAKPDILYIMSDDHTSQAIGAYGGRLAGLNPTPALDRLAGEGMLFQNVFCTNSICTPSRASVMTGQYSQADGVLTLDFLMLLTRLRTTCLSMPRATRNTSRGWISRNRQTSTPSPSSDRRAPGARTIH